MAQIKVTQVRSSIGTKPKQRGTLRALGLGRIGKSHVRTTVQRSLDIDLWLDTQRGGRFGRRPQHLSFDLSVFDHRLQKEVDRPGNGVQIGGNAELPPPGQFVSADGVPGWRRSDVMRLVTASVAAPSSASPA